MSRSHWIAMGAFGCIAFALLLGTAWYGLRRPTTERSSDAWLMRESDVRLWGTVDDLPERLAILPTVFWEPADTTSLRQWIRLSPSVPGNSVLEIGTGSGLISLCCLHAGAKKVVATDINPNAIKAAQLNAYRLGLADHFETRLVPPENAGAFAVIKKDEKFDLIISNPPWEDGTPKSIDQYALYDPNFELIKSLLQGANEHLHDGGQVLLAYGCKTAIVLIEQLAAEEGWESERLDGRNFEELPEVFLPGMLLRLKRSEPLK